MAGIIPVAPLPFPPDTYDQQYFNETIRALNLYFRQLQNPGPVIGSTFRALNLPTSDTGLPVGSFWVDASAGNVIKVVV
jgi:hypothetical protein